MTNSSYVFWVSEHFCTIPNVTIKIPLTYLTSLIITFFHDAKEINMFNFESINIINHVVKITLNINLNTKNCVHFVRRKKRKLIFFYWSVFIFLWILIDFCTLKVVFFVHYDMRKKGTHFNFISKKFTIMSREINWIFFPLVKEINVYWIAWSCTYFANNMKWNNIRQNKCVSLVYFICLLHHKADK